MNCLVVISHPHEGSLCKFLAQRTIERLTENGHEVVIEDLYKQGFEPALTATERQSYYKTPDMSDVQESVARLQNAEALILVFPTWWFGFPGMLKGWFDRVWLPGIAFENAADLGAIKPKLDKLERVIAITTLGSPWWVDRLVLFQPVRRVLKRALLGACAPNAKLDFLSLYDSEKADERAVKAFVAKILRTVDRRL